MEDEKKSLAAGITPAKALGDLDAVVQAIMKALPPAKPWQRQLLQHLAEIERTAQVLRMTIALERDSGEVMDAKDRLASLFAWRTDMSRWVGRISAPRLRCDWHSRSACGLTKRLPE